LRPKIVANIIIIVIIIIIIIIKLAETAELTEGKSPYYK